MKKVSTIQGISEIINYYDIFILDQWGVMHDGVCGFSCAIQCIEKLFQKKKKMIIISNSSRRKALTIDKLPKLGFSKEYFSEVMTSGEMIWNSLNSKADLWAKNLGPNCYHLYDRENVDAQNYIKGLNYNFVDNVDKADFILGCTPFFKSKIIDYIPILNTALKNNIPFICANPDYETIEPSNKKLIFCIGSVAELYKDLGGKVIILGKPCVDIYREATKNIINLKKSNIVAIGDSIYHDIKGAMDFGIDSLLISSGIHKEFFSTKKPEWNSEKNILDKTNIMPTYLCSTFKY